MTPRLKVLELIEQGKISPEEGARLLQAMTPPAETRSSATWSPTQPPSSAGGWGRWPGGSRFEEAASRHLRRAARKLDLHDLRESLRDMSKEIRDAVRGGVEVVLGEDDPGGLPGFEEVDSDAVSLPEGPLPRVDIRCAGGGVKVARGAGREIRVRRHDDYLRIFARALGAEDGEIVIRARDGDLEIEAPDGLPVLEVRSDGGDTRLDIDVDRLRAAAAGGDVRFKGLAVGASVSAAGGDVHLDRLRLTSGDSKVKTAGGDLHLVLTADSDVTVTAKTVGGSVNLPEDAKTRTRQVGPVAKGGIVLGQGTAALKLASTGGDLTVEVES